MSCRCGAYDDTTLKRLGEEYIAEIRRINDRHYVANEISTSQWYSEQLDAVEQDYQRRVAAQAACVCS